MSSNFPKPARRQGQGPRRADSAYPRENAPARAHERTGGSSSPRQQKAGQQSPPPQAGTAPPAQAGQDAADGAPLLPGVKPVLELLLDSPDRVDAVFLRKGRHGKDMERIIDACRKEGVRFSLLDGPAFGRIYSGNSQGVVARLFEAGFVELDDLFTACPDSPLPIILAFDQIQDPGNAGTLARTLYALGGTGIITPRHNGVFLGGAASKAAAGAFERLPVAKVANIGQALDKARKLGFVIYGAASAPVAKVAGPENTAASLRLPVLPVLDIFSTQYRLPAILLLGSEEHGIRPGLEKRCDFLLSIPMLREFDSLNVAQAGGIIISAMLRHCLEKQLHDRETQGLK